MRCCLISIKRAKPSWDAFLCENNQLNNKEPHEAGDSKAQEKKPAFAEEIESSEVMTLRESEMAKKI